MKEFIALCGDNCRECPRYLARSNEQLRAVAELWFRVGWRDSIRPNEEMHCSGCSAEKQCTYQLTDCTRSHKVEKCSLCEEFPCETIDAMLKRSAEYQCICKERCTEAEYAALEKAFFEKEKNLRK